MTDPLEQLREQLAKMSNYLVSLTPHTNETGETAIGIAHELLDTLESVLSMPEKDDTSAIGGGQFMHIEGYNQCLSEVHALIAERLGK